MAATAILARASAAAHITLNRKPLFKALHDITTAKKEDVTSLLRNRQLWTSLLALTGGLMFISGLFLLLHLKSHVIEGIHQVVSIIFIAACAAHLVFNRKPLVKTLGKPIIAWPLLAVVLVAFWGMAFSDFDDDGKKHRYGERQKKSHGISRSIRAH